MLPKCNIGICARGQARWSEACGAGGGSKKNAAARVERDEPWFTLGRRTNRARRRNGSGSCVTRRRAGLGRLGGMVIRRRVRASLVWSMAALVSCPWGLMTPTASAEGPACAGAVRSVPARALMKPRLSDERRHLKPLLVVDDASDYDDVECVCTAAQAPEVFSAWVACNAPLVLRRAVSREFRPTFGAARGLRTETPPLRC